MGAGLERISRWRGRLRELPRGSRSAVLVAVAVFTGATTLLLPPVAQDPAYHDFADKRAFLGIVNFGDVTSNLAFLLVGGLGLGVLARARGLFKERRGSWPWLSFFLGVALVSAGSAWYHLAPDNETLVWDRLPMTVAFMGLLAGFAGDRVQSRCNDIGLAVLLALGVSSIWVWMASGDLRFYGWVKFFPMLGIPLICLLFAGRITKFRFAFEALLWFALATALELFDKQVFAALGGTVSGHTLKHLAAAVAVYRLVMMFRTVPGDTPQIRKS